MTRYVYISHSALAHHGIKGMKWGKRNGPPYPLDPSDHSAAEKKATGGRYSQGVKQDRGKKKREPMDEEKKKKIKRAIAIGAGVAGAAALTGGAIYLAKHPGTAGAIAGGAKELAKGGIQALKQRKAINKLENKDIVKQSLKNLKAHNKEKRSDVFKNIKSANATDRENNLLKKWDRQYKRQEKKGILSGDIIKNKSKLEDSILERPERLFKNRDKIIKEHGYKTFNDLASSVTRTNASDRVAANEYRAYKNSKGVRGAARKVWAPIAGAAGVMGTVGGTIGRINSSVNTVANTARNPVYRKLYNDFMSDPYYEEQQRENRKKYNNNNRR